MKPYSATSWKRNIFHHEWEYGEEMAADLATISEASSSSD